MFQSIRLRRAARLLVAVTAAAVLVAPVAEAKVGGGGSVGSRGSRTFSAPPTTRTAPGTAAPIQRSITSPSAQTAATATSRPSMFGGFRGLLLGGLMAGALASIFGVGALANVLGFVLQAVVIGWLVMLAYNFFTRRRDGAAMASARSSVGASPRPIDMNAYRASGTGGSGAPPLTVTPDDFNAFERLLGEIQLAYGRGDTATLSQRVTPEMLSYFSGDLSANGRKGVRNEITDPKLLQGDLSEAWREGQSEYATVAMRFSLLDRMVDVASGRIVSGSASAPSESTELWTFRRPLNASPREWELSAIQQA